MAGGKHEGGRKSSQGGRGESSKASPVAIEKYLKGLDYPCEKQDLIDTAEENGAPDDVMYVLEQIPEGEYNSPTDVSKAIGDTE